MKPKANPVGIDGIKIEKDSIYLFGGDINGANGYYKEMPLTKPGNITLYNNNIQLLFQHQSNSPQSSHYFIIKSKLKSHEDKMHWMIISINDEFVNIKNMKELSDMNMKIFYICKQRICAPANHPPCFNWKAVIHQNVIRHQAPIIIKGDDYFGWNHDKHDLLSALKCSETDFNDRNIYNVIPLDVETYSTQHSYYKHLSFGGSYHTVVPINGGQRRNRQAAPLHAHEIRWHVRDVHYLKNDVGKEEIEDVNDWIWIKHIAIKHQFKFNCFLGGTRHGNWHIAIGSNKDCIPYLEKKYTYFKGGVSQYGAKQICKDMIYEEEHMIQIENAIHCALKIYTEINQVIMGWRKVVNKWAMEEHVPQEIIAKIVEFCNIKLKDLYWNEANNSWRSWLKKK